MCTTESSWRTHNNVRTKWTVCVRADRYKWRLKTGSHLDQRHLRKLLHCVVTVVNHHPSHKLSTFFNLSLCLVSLHVLCLFVCLQYLSHSVLFCFVCLSLLHLHVSLSMFACVSREREGSPDYDVMSRKSRLVLLLVLSSVFCLACMLSIVVFVLFVCL